MKHNIESHARPGADHLETLPEASTFSHPERRRVRRSLPKTALRFGIGFAAITFGAWGQDFEQRFELPLFRNDLTPLTTDDKEIVSVLAQTPETAGCGFRGVIRGRFTGPGKQEAIVSSACGEAHADNFGSSILLSHEPGRPWRFSWREVGMITNHCARFKFGAGRDGLLCKDLHQGWGEQMQSLYSIDASKPARKRVSYLVITTDDVSAAWERSTQANIEGVNLGPPLTVAVRYGVASLSPEAKSKMFAPKPEFPNIPTKTYQLEFSFDGARFVPTQSTVGILDMIKRRSLPAN